MGTLTMLLATFAVGTLLYLATFAVAEVVLFLEDCFDSHHEFIYDYVRNVRNVLEKELA